MQYLITEEEAELLRELLKRNRPLSTLITKALSNGFTIKDIETFIFDFKKNKIKVPIKIAFEIFLYGRTLYECEKIYTYYLSQKNENGIHLRPKQLIAIQDCFQIDYLDFETITDYISIVENTFIKEKQKYENKNITINKLMSKIVEFSKKYQNENFEVCADFIKDEIIYKEEPTEEDGND